MIRAFLGFALLALTVLPAEARSISGFLGECTAVAVGSCTELTGVGYARQPISFSNPVNGVTVSAVPYQFPQTLSGTIVGRGVYDAVTGGNLLLVLPIGSSMVLGTPGDQADVGALRFTIAAAAALPDGEAFNATYQAGSVLGTTAQGSNVTAGSAVSFQHGFGAVNLGAADPNTRSPTQTTGFSYAVPAGISSLNLKAAGTLAAGTVTLPVAPTDGFLFRLACSVTITALTMTPGAGSTVIGTAPTTCGANASHELQYFAADQTWHVLF